MPISLWAQYQDLESLLKTLDVVVGQKDIYTLPKEQDLSDLRDRLKNTKDNRQKYALCDKLFTGYLHYQADSALA